jgi:hypothetical protein
MDTWIWILIIVAIVVVAFVVIATALASGRRRRNHLKETFGSEYERVATDEHGKPTREGEKELRRRENRRADLDIRPLSAQQQQRYLMQWREIQTEFVDTPDRSVASAETLVNRVMQERGYPVEADFENQAELISVDHPELVNNYRQAHQVYLRSLSDSADTEELRNSLVYYRSLFNELLAA